MNNVVILPHQGRMMQAPYLFPEIRYFFNIMGYGAGKTRGLVFAILYAINILNGKKDRAGDYARIIVAGYTLSHLNKTLLIYLRQTLETCQVPYIENKKDNYFIVGTVTILLLPTENPENLFGMEGWAVFSDETDELPEDKAVEAVKALSERCRQRIIGLREPFLCFNSTAQGQKGLYRIYHHFKKSGVGFLLLRGRTEDNPFLPSSQIRDMKKMYTPEEFRCFCLGEFLAIAKGRVFPDFDWERNYLNYDLDTKLRPNESVFIGMDFNVSYNRASAYVVRDGVIYGIKYYDFQNPQDAASVFRHDFPNQKIYWIPDVTIKDSFPQFARDLQKYDIQIIYRKKSPLVEDTVFLMNKLFFTGRLVVCKIAKDLAEAFALAMRDKDNKIPKGVGQNCLYPTTRVLTKRGWVQIKHVCTSDHVLTRQGWRRVLWSGCTGTKDIGIFDNKLLCTSDHPIMNELSKKEAGLMSGIDYYDAISAKEGKKWMNLGELELLMGDAVKYMSCLFGITSFGTDVPMRRHENTEFTTIMRFVEKLKEHIVDQLDYTLLSMKNILVLFLMGIVFTTGILIRLTIVRKICSYLLIGNMRRYTQGNGKKIIPEWRRSLQRKLDLRQMSGIVAPKDVLWQSGLQKHGGILKKRVIMYVLSAVHSLAQNLFKASSSIVVKTVKQPRCGENERAFLSLMKNVEVWDISVDEVHEFCAEGIFVSNSPIHAIDGGRYACSFIAIRDPSFADMRKLVLEKRASFRDEDDGPVKELGSGYMQVDPAALIDGRRR